MDSSYSDAAVPNGGVGSSTVLFHRASRPEVPRAPGGELAVQPPPEVPRAIPGNLLLKLMPVVMLVAMAGMMLLLFTSGGVGANPATLIFPLMMAVSMLAMFVGQTGRSGRTAEADEERKDYLRYLGRLRRDVVDTAAQQRAALAWCHPDPAMIWTLAGTYRMWERRTTDPDYGHVRVGLGDQRLATRLIAPETGPVEELEPIAAVSLRRFVRTHSVVHRLPTAVALRGFATITIGGDRIAARALARSMLLQLCMFHGPDQLSVAVVCGPDTAPEWEWIKWLPHAQHATVRDAAGSGRMYFGSMRESADALAAELAGRGRFARDTSARPDLPQIVVVVDGGLFGGAEFVGAAGMESVTVLDLCGYAITDGTPSLSLVVEGGSVGARSEAGLEMFAVADAISTRQAEQVARRLAPFRLPARPAGGSGPVAEEQADWARLIGLGDLGAFDPNLAWSPRLGRDRLRVPFGRTTDGAVVELDLKEAAENGMGPHGLCIGATGSGKSEFLRTLVLGLLATHSPDQLNLVLVDFKGGATFLGLDGIPHVAAVITNLAEEVTLVDRMRDALAGEINRRQELLRSAGNFANVGDYEQARAAGAELAPLPALFIVIDEFSELLSQQPDFADLFVAIGRLGRSLHIHLLLASQRLDEGRLRGLDSHLSYRIGLKTFSANESRVVLGVPDAYHLPGSPGSGYLRADATEIRRFRSAYVSGPYRNQAGRSPRPPVPGGVRAGTVRLFTAAPVVADPPAPAAEPAVPPSTEMPPSTDTPPSTETPPSTATALSVLVERIRGYRGRRAHEIWLPPLTASPTLDQLVAERSSDAGPPLRVPIGVLDRPFEQRRDQLVLDLSGAAGHVAIVGGPQAGKSTAARTLIMSLCSLHTPEQVQLYCLDFGGGTLAGVSGLPHVGSVASRLDQARVRRTVAELTGLIRRRERTFAERGIESMAQFRGLRAADAAVDPFGDVFLVIDGFSGFRRDFEALEPVIGTLAAEGLSFGLHLVLTLSRWADARPALKDQLGTRLELRLGDPADSELGRRVATLVPEGRPGRGITGSGLHFLVGLPRTDGDRDPATLSVGVAAAVRDIAAGAGGRHAPPVRLLPDRLSRTELLAAVGERSVPTDSAVRAPRVPLGLNEAELTPVFLEFEEQQHFLVFGDVECGKTTLLRGICAGIVAANEPNRARILLVDYRRTMLGAVPEEYLAGYSSDATTLERHVGELAAHLHGRRPPTDVTPRQLRDREWLTDRPELYLVVDDYDLVVTGAGNPLAPLIEFLPQARDVGMHLIVARRSGGAGRALYEPLIARMRDLAAAGLVMSGSRDEGNLIGTVRAAAMPPGRGIFVGRRATGVIQSAWLPPL
ncbi:type VII secretion protein EccCa [Skermania piniformis]|uniref:Type VII secretion protein EccCa n=1 Tax=Skermania pinensis TaxID=39122 RepID=A0ABX8SAZ4_9ACTN|nr:type VII secretion protein EccCa [Skermania piniformis]QXQ14621.1 type VII secretion protein EccCa [Skermania piniformis]